MAKCHDFGCAKSTPTGGAYCTDHAKQHGFTSAQESFIRGTCRGKWCRAKTVNGEDYCKKHALSTHSHPEETRAVVSAIAPTMPVKTNTMDHAFLSAIAQRQDEITVLERAHQILRDLGSDR